MSETKNCRWAGPDRPRIVPDRHGDDCADETCRGCQACTQAHCRICGITHTSGTCGECLAETRDALTEIGRLCDSLPDEVQHRGVEGEAMMLLGPVANPEARGYVETAYLSGRLPEGWIEAAHGRDCPRLRNEACSGCAGGELHPLTVLGTWEMVWRDALEHDTADLIDVANAADYLDRNLTYMAGYEHVPFEDFAHDLRRCRAHLEAVLHDGEQIERGAPCPECGRILLHEYGERFVDDRWRCPNRRCGIAYTNREYRGWVAADARNEADRLTAEDMELRFDVKASVVRVWGSRGLIHKRGRTPLGMTLYDVADVAGRLAEDVSA